MTCFAIGKYEEGSTLVFVGRFEGDKPVWTTDPDMSMPYAQKNSVMQRVKNDKNLEGAFAVSMKRTVIHPQGTKQSEEDKEDNKFEVLEEGGNHQIRKYPNGRRALWIGVTENGPNWCVNEEMRLRVKNSSSKATLQFQIKADSDEFIEKPIDFVENTYRLRSSKSNGSEYRLIFRVDVM